jgi:hypothetical protein
MEFDSPKQIGYRLSGFMPEVRAYETAIYIDIRISPKKLKNYKVVGYPFERFWSLESKEWTLKSKLAFFRMTEEKLCMKK